MQPGGVHPEEVIDGRPDVVRRVGRRRGIGPDAIRPADYLSAADTAFFGEEMGEVAGVLEGAGQLRRAGDRWYWSGTGYPAADVDIRSAGGTPFSILNADGLSSGL